MPMPDDPLWLFHKKPVHDEHDGEIFYMHAIYHDYYEYLHIIEQRMEQDYNDYKLGLKELARIFKIKDKTLRDSEELANVKKLTIISKSIQLDSESYILFGRILLDKLGHLIELVLNSPNKHSLNDSFTKHKKYFIKNKHHNPRYSNLLIDMYWYDQYFLILRDKIIQHGKQWHTWLKPEDELIHILMGKNHGLIDDRRKADLESIVKKYAPHYIKEVENVNNLPLSDIPVLIHKVLSECTRMEEKDLRKLDAIVGFTGAAVHIPTVSKKIHQFLKDVAIIFQDST